MKLIKTIEKIFEKNDFLLKQINGKEWECILASRTESSKKQEFFVIIDKGSGSNEEDLKELFKNGIQQIYQIIKSGGHCNNTFDKNATLIICYNGPATPESDIISQIEEDPYVFKKNVLIYSKKQMEELNGLIGNDFTVDNLNKLLNKASNFEKMKRGDQDSGYALLCRLFVKLPFLVYKKDTETTLHSLPEQIESELQKKELYRFCEDTLQIDWESIDSYEKLPKSLIGTTGGKDV